MRKAFADMQHRGGSVNEPRDRPHLSAVQGSGRLRGEEARSGVGGPSSFEQDLQRLYQDSYMGVLAF
jgi:hypothetical protein